DVVRALSVLRRERVRHQRQAGLRPLLGAAVEAVDALVAEPLGELRRRQAAHALRAHEQHRVIARDRLLGIGAERLERNETRVRQVAGTPLALVTNVDHVDDVVGEEVGGGLRLQRLYHNGSVIAESAMADKLSVLAAGGEAPQYRDHRVYVLADIVESE